MSIIDKASLVLIPSGYSEGFVYPIKNPINPGRISYTRSATSTRVNSKGLIEYAPYNLFIQTENLTNTSAWIQVQHNVVLSGIPPTGLNTSYKLTDKDSGVLARYFIQSVVLASEGTHTASGYFKAAEYNFIQIHPSGDNGTAFNLSNGTFTILGAGTATMTNVGDGWYRCSYTWSRAAGNFNLHYSPSVAGNYSYDGTAGSGIFMSSPQLEMSSAPSPYVATTNRLNFPTLDYSTGKPTFLFEPSVTNLLTYSEDFSNVVWSKEGTNVDSNQTIAPNGSNTADTVSTSTGNQYHRFYTGPFTYASTLTIFSFSVYLKYKDHRYVSFGVTDNLIYRSQVVVDLVSGVITENYVQSGTLTSNLQPVGNGWYRLTGTFTPSEYYTGGHVYLLGFLLNQSTWSYEGYIGTRTGAYIWGAQLQEGTAATSYIPTTNASVTRAGGSTAALGSSYFGTNKGTLLLGVEGIKTLVSSGSAATVDLISGASRVITLYENSSGLGFYDYYANATLCTVDKTTKKMLIKWDGTTSVGFVNGVKTTTLTTGSARSIDNMAGLKSALTAYNLSVFAIFPEALSDAECIFLTS
jgi:hypothetical protein